MNIRIGTSFGLALLLALGIIATMLALGMFSSSAKVKAAAVPIGHIVNTAVNAPTTPGAVATYTFTFQNPAVVAAGSGQLFVKFDSLITVPPTIGKERITISVSGGGTSNPLIDPTITTDSAGDTVIVITVGDTDPNTAGTQNLGIYTDNAVSGGTNVNNGHVLQFSALAGIKNSTFPSQNAAWVNMSDDGVTYNVTPQEIPVFRYLSMSAGAGARGTVITVTGKGYSSGTTATVFLDNTDVVANTTFALDSGEDVLATSDSTISNGEFTATFSANTNFGVGPNSINAVDGTGTGAGNPAQGARYQSQTFTLIGLITLGSTSASRGGGLAITLSDFTGAGPITAVTIGGILADLTDVGGLAIANGTTSIAVTVPSTTPLGTQLVTVTATTEGAARVANVEVVGLTLIASPSTAVAGQAITVSGSGFTASGHIAAVTVGGVAQERLTNGSAVDSVRMDNSGNLVASFAIPNNDVTRTVGTHILRITDSGNRIGEAVITVPAKTLVLDPSTSKRSSTVSFTGSGYVAGLTVTVNYSGRTVTTVQADGAGAISGFFFVPTLSGIPSANTVAANSAFTSGTDGVQINLTGATTHTVPAAVITIDPVSAASGQTVTVSGTGFPGFVSLSALKIGGVSALPSPAPATDTNGTFTAEALVPELAVGSQSMVATVGVDITGITATTNFTVTATPTTPTVTTANTADVFAAEVTADNLARVWWFDNATQAWSFYDPRPAFAMANTYTTASTGAIVWVNVTAQTTFQGQTLFPGWNLISLQ